MTRNSRNHTSKIAAALAAITTVGVLPVTAMAAPQTRREEAAQRQKTKNQWRNIAIAAGAVAAYGVVKKNTTIGLLGAAGALYSLNRYEQDRKSQDSLARERVNFYSRPSFYRNGQRYERQTVTRNGERFYQYVKR